MPFDVRAHLEARAEIPDFTLVEFGYGQCPIYGRQPHHFTGQQAYIGIEAGLRDREKAKARADRLNTAQEEGKNIRFMFVDVGYGEVVPATVYHHGYEEYRGVYNPKTPLDSSIADETFAGNIFCDPLTTDYERTLALMSEMGRVTKLNGLVIMRETITPHYVYAVGEFTTSRSGLDIVDYVRPDTEPLWHQLEAFYGTGLPHDYSPPLPDSYYLFLRKVC